MTSTTVKMTPTETALLASIVHPGVYSRGNANRTQQKALERKGFLAREHGTWGDLIVTDAGREAVAAIYPPEAVEAQRQQVAALQAENGRQRREQAAQAQRLADARNAAARTLASLMPDRLLKGIRPDARTTGGRVYGAQTYAALTSTDVLAIVQAALDAERRVTAD